MRFLVEGVMGIRFLPEGVMVMGIVSAQMKWIYTLPGKMLDDSDSFGNDAKTEVDSLSLQFVDSLSLPFQSLTNKRQGAV
jgi:hypothetical protein